MTPNDVEVISARLDRIEGKVDLLLAKLSSSTQLSDRVPLPARVPLRTEESQLPLMPSRSLTSRKELKPSPLKNMQIRMMKLDAAQWLGILGGFTIVLSALFLVRLGISNGTITPPIQLAGVTALGIASLSLALRLQANDRRYFSILGGAGIAILFIAAYSSSEGLGVLSSAQALGMTVFVSILSLVISDFFKSRLFGLLACIGTLIGPWAFPILGPWQLIGFYSIWTLLFCFEARRLAAIEMVVMTAFLSLIPTVLRSGSAYSNLSWLWPLGFLAPQFVIFTVAASSFEWNLSPRPKAWFKFALLPLALLFYTQQRLLLPDVTFTSPFWSAASVGFLVVLLLRPTRILPSVQELQNLLIGFIACSFFGDFYRVYTDAHALLVLPFLGFAFYLY